MTNFHPDGRVLGITYLPAKGGRPPRIRVARHGDDTMWVVNGANIATVYKKAVERVCEIVGYDDYAAMKCTLPLFMKFYGLTLRSDIVQVLVEEKK